MKEGSNQRILEKYKYLTEDSLYRENSSDFTKRTITPVMASLAELLRNTPGYEEHYDWFIELAKNFHQIQMEMVKARNDFAVICSESQFEIERVDRENGVEEVGLDLRIAALVR